MRKSWTILLVMSIAMVMSVLDSTIVNVAIARLQTVFGASTDAVQWVITGYLLTFAIMLAATGWLSDRFGYKPVFVSSVALFTLGSLLCSLSWSLPALIAFRLVQGIGGGMMGPSSMAIVMREFPKEKLGTAIAVYMIPTLAFSSFGPTIGGWLIDTFSWQTMFIVNVPVGIIGLVLSVIVLRHYPLKETGRFDFLGFGSLAAALGALLLALADGNADWNTDGWTSTFMLTCYGVSVAGFALFAICQMTTDHPVIDFSLFRNFNFSLTAVLLFVFGLGIFGSDFLLPLYLQVGLGYTPMQAGMVFLLNGIVMIVGAVVGGRLMDRIGPKIPGIAGIVLRAYGMYRFSHLSTDTSLGEILITQCFLAGGMGLLMSPLQTTAIAEIEPDRAAQASGLIQIIRQLGGSFGVALLSTILMHRERIHTVFVGETMSNTTPTFKTILSRTYFYALHVAGGTQSQAASQAQSLVLSHVQTQIFVWSIDDLFFLTMLVSVLSSVPFLFVRTGRNRRRSATASPALG